MARGLLVVVLLLMSARRRGGGCQLGTLVASRIRGRVRDDADGAPSATVAVVGIGSHDSPVRAGIVGRLAHDATAVVGVHVGGRGSLNLLPRGGAAVKVKAAASLWGRDGDLVQTLVGPPLVVRERSVRVRGPPFLVAVLTRVPAPPGTIARIGGAVYLTSNDAGGQGPARGSVFLKERRKETRARVSVTSAAMADNGSERTGLVAHEVTRPGRVRVASGTGGFS